MTPTPLSLSLNLNLSLNGAEVAMPGMGRLFDQGGPALRIWTPDAAPPPIRQPPDTRSTTPGVHQELFPGPVRPALPAPAEPPQQQPPPSLFAELAESHQVGPRRVAAAERERLGALMIDEFYEQSMRAWREEQLAKGKVKPGTLAKERQHLRRFRAWEAGTRPEKWPADFEWRGCPLAFIAGGYLDRYYAAAAAQYAKDSIRSARGHLSAILNYGVAIGVLDSAPASSPLDFSQSPAADDCGDEDLVTVWTRDELPRAYAALAPRLDLQTAFVLGCCAGARTHDLFQLRWNKDVLLDRAPPWIRFRAKKSRKSHGFPLMSTALAQLRRWRERQQSERLFEPSGLVFPQLAVSRDVNQDPEKSKAARRRNALVKELLAACGLPPHEKPWQVCRATCCTRVNDVDRRANIGSWMIGQSGVQRAGTKLAADHYDNPAEQAIEVILRCPPPTGWPT